MPGRKIGDEVLFDATAESGYTQSADGQGFRLRVMDETSRVTVFEVRIPIEEWGRVVAGGGSSGVIEARVFPGSLDRIGKVYEHQRIVVSTIRDSRDYARAEVLAEEWLDENKLLWREYGWAVEVPRGDGTTHGSGYNSHRQTAAGYELTLWRYVDPQQPKWIEGDRVEVRAFLPTDVDGVATWLPGTIERFEEAVGGYAPGTFRATVLLDGGTGRRLTRYSARDGSPLGDEPEIIDGAVVQEVGS